MKSGSCTVLPTLPMASGAFGVLLWCPCASPAGSPLSQGVLLFPGAGASWEGTSGPFHSFPQDYLSVPHASHGPSRMEVLPMEVKQRSLSEPRAMRSSGMSFKPGWFSKPGWDSLEIGLEMEKLCREVQCLVKPNQLPRSRCPAPQPFPVSLSYPSMGSPSPNCQEKPGNQ